MTGDEPLQRGVPRRRAHPRRPTCSARCNGGWGVRHHHADQRARPHRRRHRPRDTVAADRRWPSKLGRSRRPGAAPGARRLLHPPADPALPRLPAADGAVSQGGPPGPETSIMKLFAAEYLQPPRRRRPRRARARRACCRRRRRRLDGVAAAVPARARRSASPAAPTRSSATSSASGCSAFPGDPTTDRDVPFRELARPVP